MSADRTHVADLTLAERLNFLLTNRIPRRWATLLAGRLGAIESRWFTAVGMAVWQAFGGDLGLHEAEKASFESLQACFTRKLRPGARPVNADERIITSPCDAIVGQFGRVKQDTIYQAKGYPYSMAELVSDPAVAARFAGGNFITLRLRSNFYHRFHAPADVTISRVTYISGDTWNVNPIALKCIERLFCRNERAVVEMRLTNGRGALLLVPVAAILVASMHFDFLDTPFGLQYRGPASIDCAERRSKGQELGHFRLGSTIVVFAESHMCPVPALSTGMNIRMGEPLLVSANTACM